VCVSVSVSVSVPKYMLTSLNPLVGTIWREGRARFPWKQRSKRRHGKMMMMRTMMMRKEEEQY